MTEEKKAGKDPNWRKDSNGPFSPPLPKTAESEEKEPFAVRGDKTTDRQSFLPTSADLDSFDEEVAQRYNSHVTKENMLPKSDKETRAMQDPPGYTKTDERGYRHLDADEVEKEY